MYSTQTTARIRLQTLLSRTPLLGPASRALAQLSPVARLLGRSTFRGSASYWEERYRSGGTSGAGSYGQLARFKAEILNAFVAEKGIRTVVEFGCGDGAQLELARYPSYVGVDVSPASIELCRRRFEGDPAKRFHLTSRLPPDLGRFDLALSLDVIYHLVEDATFAGYMDTLFAHAQRHVVIYSSNRSEATASPHVRHREFTAWIAQRRPEWRLVRHIPNRYPYDAERPHETSFADFHVFERAPG